MMTVTDEEIATARMVPVEDVVRSYVRLRYVPGSLTVRCPFCGYRTFRFSRYGWICFGRCNESGDVIAFMQMIENLSFTEAVRKLAARQAARP